jgi:hypothetical protein
MKTQTKNKIIEIVRKNRRARPHELAKQLNLSSQAIHRHLKALVENSILEPRGKPPFTAYALAGVPSFEDAMTWIKTGQRKTSSESTICQTRDVFTARLNHLKPYQAEGLDRNNLSLLMAVMGEIGNNSFDHNIGHWADTPGCWFQSELTGHSIWILIGDRGQGILASLKPLYPYIQSHGEAIEAAFEKPVSGRASEHRGNGLKFVKSVILSTKKAGLACASGSGLLEFGSQGMECAKYLNLGRTIKGVATLITWGIK